MSRCAGMMASKRQQTEQVEVVEVGGLVQQEHVGHSGTVQIGHYEVLAELGRGGMGVVYRARDLRLGREVAIKRLLPTVASKGAAAQRLRTEAQALSRLQHPGIVKESEPERKETAPRPRPVADLVEPRIDEILLAWGPRTTPKQRVTAKRLHRQLVAGPIGTEKTHLAIALGVEATRRRKRV
jgi:serine/threonine protein kinase